ncbi:MAG: hypothetical protein ACYDBQ_11065 [Thermoplasmatota archaeon]
MRLWWLPLLVAGCMTTPTGLGAPPSVALHVALHCGGPNETSFEFGALGSCWGHFGHATYLLDPPLTVTRIEGTITAVEAEAAGIRGAPALSIEASLDGRRWTPIASLLYPQSGTGATEERHTWAFDAPVGNASVRLLRIRMPLSTQEGLAGYLDHTDLAITGGKATLEPPAPRATSDCAQGLLESFFPTHPCWFGGDDPIDNVTGSPDAVHLGMKPKGSYYDAPSFLHTHALWNASGAFRANVIADSWRTTNQFALCSAEGNGAFPVQPHVFAQASANGTTWRTVATAQGNWGAPIVLRGVLPAATAFVRFQVERAPGDATDPACHHPAGFLVASQIELGP